MQVSAAVIVSRANACARSARATPLGGSQPPLGPQLALDRHDQSPAADIRGKHLDDRVRTGVLVSTPTRSCGEDDGRPGPDREASIMEPSTRAINSAAHSGPQQQTERSLSAANPTRATVAEVIPWPRDGGAPA